MSKVVKRGYILSDEKEFSSKAIEKLHKAGNNLYYLLNEGYKIKGASTFVGNHYLLSERQRQALVRAISMKNNINLRLEKEVKDNLEGQVVKIDGFNTIISLEVALSDSLLLKCMDGTIRDLAGLRGTYKLIDKTDVAISLIGRKLEDYKIKKVVFYLDAPVSNSGRLKQRILELLVSFNFEIEVQNINNVDSTLEKLDYVITTDAIILDKCISWINLNKDIIEEENFKSLYVDFSGIGE